MDTTSIILLIVGLAVIVIASYVLENLKEGCVNKDLQLSLNIMLMLGTMLFGFSTSAILCNSNCGGCSITSGGFYKSILISLPLALSVLSGFVLANLSDEQCEPEGKASLYMISILMGVCVLLTGGFSYMTIKKLKK